jgi:hypothetical protein
LELVGLFSCQEPEGDFFRPEHTNLLPVLPRFLTIL